MKNFYRNISNLKLLKNIKHAISSFNKTEWKIFLVLLVVLFVSTLLILEKINKSFMVSVPVRGGSITEGIIGTPRFINPILASSDPDKDLVALIYSGLTRKDNDGNIIPDLAEKFEISKDGLNYTFTLKDKIYFHDNEKITSDDVIFTINQIKDPIIKSPNKINWDGVSIIKVDDKTIKFTLKQPYVSFLENTTIGILPLHLWKDGPIELNKNNENPIGSGPYKINKINKKSSGVVDNYELTSFSKFALGKPYIKNIKLNFYTNENEVVDALLKNEIDQAGSISPENAEKLKEKKYKIETRVLPRVFSLFFNQNQNQIFIDKNTLQAINLSINKERIINEVLLGYGTLIDSPVLPNIISDEKLKNNNINNDYNNNFKKAEELLKKNNWVKNKDGFLEKTITENKRKKTSLLEFSISTSNTPELVKTAELIKEDLQNLGIKIEIKTFDVGNLNQLVIRPRKYDALLFGQILNSEADLFAFWHSSQRTDPGLNVAMYTNKKVDKILEDIFTMTDKKERVKKYVLFKDELKKDIPAVFIYNPNYIYIVSKNLNGFDVKNIIDIEERFSNVYNWSIKKEDVWKIFAK